MPQIIVRADDGEGGSVMLRERVTIADFQSGRFATNLVERLGWAVGDATEAERRDPAPEKPRGRRFVREHEEQRAEQRDAEPALA